MELRTRGARIRARRLLQPVRGLRDRAGESHNCHAPAGARVAAHAVLFWLVAALRGQERWHIDTVQKTMGRRPRLRMVAIYLGAGIFCAHYVGTQSTKLQWEGTDSDIPAKYDLTTVIATFLGAVLMAWWAVAVAADDVFYKRTKAERLAVVRQEVTRTSSLVSRRSACPCRGVAAAR